MNLIRTFQKRWKVRPPIEGLTFSKGWVSQEAASPAAEAGSPPVTDTCVTLPS